MLVNHVLLMAFYAIIARAREANHIMIRLMIIRIKMAVITINYALSRLTRRTLGIIYYTFQHVVVIMTCIATQLPGHIMLVSHIRIMAKGTVWILIRQLCIVML